MPPHKPPAQKPTATPSSTDDFASDLAGLTSDDFAGDLSTVKNGVTANRDFEQTFPHQPEPPHVRPGSPRDMLERTSERLFGRAAPIVNEAVVGAARLIPGTSIPTALIEGGAPTGGMLGGTLGGITGSIPGAIAGASAGGAGGGYLERWFRGEPTTGGDVAFDAGSQGALQAVAPVFGSALKAAALPVYRMALRPGAAITRAFGDVSKRGLEDGVPALSATAIPKTEAATTASNAAADAMIAKAETDTNGLRAREVTSALKPAFVKARNQEALGAGNAGTEALKRRVRAIVDEFGGTRAVRPIPEGPPTPAIPEGPPTVVRIEPRAPIAESGDEALSRAEFQLGHQADHVPTSVFRPTEAEARVARELGPSTAGTIPRRILNGPPKTPTPTEFVTPGTPAVPSRPGTPAVPGVPAVEGRMKLTRAQELKREAQAMASDAFTAKDKGARIDEVSALADTDIAVALQKALEARVPGLRAQNLNTKELLGLVKALQQSETRHLAGSGGNIASDVLAGGAGMMAGGPVGAGTGIAASRVLRSLGPGPVSRAAIGMDRAGKFGIEHGDKLANAARALALAIRGQDDTPPTHPPVAPTPTPTPPPAQDNDPTWKRADGSRKGQGFLGVLNRPDGNVSTELSVGVNIDGRDMDIPTLVPGLTSQERNWLLAHGDDPKAIPPAIIDKAVAHARKRLAAGQPVFAP